jgi:hypothetical protein
VFFWKLRWLKRKDFQCSIVVKNSQEKLLTNPLQDYIHMVES